MGKKSDRDVEPIDPNPPFPFFQEDEPEGDPPAKAGAADTDEGDEDEWEPPSREEWEAHQDRLAAAEENAKDARDAVDQNNQLIRDLVGRQSPISHPEPEPEEPGPMPDPSLDKDGFASWLTKRDNYADARLTRQLREAQSRLDQSSRANDLFAEFVAKYPAMADKRDVVELAARRSGVRPSDPKEKIIKKTLEQLTVLGFQLEEQPDGDPPPRRRTGGGGRTVGLGGASGARRRRTTPKEPAEEEVKDLVDQVSEDQVRLGIM